MLIIAFTLVCPHFETVSRGDRLPVTCIVGLAGGCLYRDHGDDGKNRHPCRPTGGTSASTRLPPPAI